MKTVASYSVLHNKPEFPTFAKLVCVTLLRPKVEIQPLFQKTFELNQSFLL